MRPDKTLEVIETVRAAEEAAEHSWGLDSDLEPLRLAARKLADHGLLQTADRETRAELSAWEGRPVRWAVRVSTAGHDLLLYHRVRPLPTPVVPGPGQRLVELLPSQMTALRLFVSLADQLRTPLAEGLAAQTRTAVHDAGAGRWRLSLTTEQMESMAYGFWLHKMTGSSGEANRFSRAYGVLHQPDRQPDS
ncbi:DUF6417 family protein [Streptomyces sp. NPDC006872]|uniref:DUF6417 family protein n=1 Tax=Streptomyces sp. NPDC006872 TaxID=3155720 RepID=UPI0033D38CA3